MGLHESQRATTEIYERADILITDAIADYATQSVLPIGHLIPRLASCHIYFDVYFRRGLP